MKKPIIGIVANDEYIDKSIYKKLVYDVNDSYIKMISDNGGVPLIIPTCNKLDDYKDLLKTVDGLLLIGGVDVAKTKRDLFEIEIYDYFKKSNKPILGICRGLQLINVAEKGTLKDIEETTVEHSIGIDGWVNHHFIDIDKETKLYQIIKETRYPVSSVHHQQVNKLGKNLKVSAVADDGVIEAIESNNNNFLVAFQGHIENILNNFNKYNLVIKEFIKEANNEKR